MWYHITHNTCDASIMRVIVLLVLHTKHTIIVLCTDILLHHVDGGLCASREWNITLRIMWYHMHNVMLFHMIMLSHNTNTDIR